MVYVGILDVSLLVSVLFSLTLLALVFVSKHFYVCLIIELVGSVVASKHTFVF